MEIISALLVSSLSPFGSRIPSLGSISSLYDIDLADIAIFFRQVRGTVLAQL